MRRPLYFFPAFLPLLEIIPWLLTLIGTVAGGIGFAGFRKWKERRRLILAFGLVCFLAAGGVVLWSMPDKEVRDEGSRLIQKEFFPVVKTLSAHTTMARPLPAEKFGELWSKDVKKQILAAPVIIDGMMVIGTYTGEIEAYSLTTREMLWSLHLDNPVFAIGNDSKTIYTCEGLHHTKAASLTALAIPDGKVLWQRQFLGHIKSPPLVQEDENRLWIGAGPGGLWSLRAEDGKVFWHNQIGHIDSTPLVRGNVVIVPAQPDESKQESLLYALDAKSGEGRWLRPLQGQPWGTPLLDKTGNKVFLTSGIGQIGVNRSTDKGWAEAVAVADGKLLWEVTLPGMAVEPSSYLAAADLVFHTLKSGELVALHAADGSIAWSAKIGSDIQAAATLIEGSGAPLIAVIAFDGNFSIRDAVSGVELARRVLPKNSTSSPMVEGDRIYVTTPYRIDAFQGLAALSRGVLP